MAEHVRYRRRDPADELKALGAVIVLTLLVLAGAWWVVNHRPPAEAHEETPATPSAKADPNDPVMIEVNGEPIRVSEFEAALATVPAQMREQLNSESARKEMAEELVKMKLLEQHARRIGLHNDPRVRGRLGMMEANLLANEALRKIMENAKPITVEEAYERNKSRFETARVKAIVIPYEGSRAQPKSGKPLPLPAARAKADELTARLRKGENFGTIARAESADNMGGELGLVSRGTMPPDIDQLLFTIPVGQISDPMVSPFGVHVFQVTERKFRTIDELRPLLQQQARTFTADALIEDLRKKARVEFKEPYFRKQG